MVSEPKKAPDIAIVFPTDFSESRMNLENSGSLLEIGDSLARARDVFPKPPQAFDIQDKVVALGSKYRTRGWHTATQSVAFALLDDHLVAVVKTTENVLPSEVNDAISRYSRSLGEPDQVINEGPYHYAFWIDAGAVLMVGNAVTPEGQISLTESLTHPKATPALEMDPVQVNSAVKVANAKRIKAEEAKN